MSKNNGIIRVARKGKKKFAFGEEGEPFEVDVVVSFQEWICIDDEFRELSDDRSIPNTEMPRYHQAAVTFVERLAGAGVANGVVFTQQLTTAEALDFIARLQECYGEVAAFFRPRLREEPDLPATSAAELRFSVEGS